MEPPLLSPLLICTVVTGPNEGIGLGTCTLLASNGIMVIVTARDVKKDLEAVRQLKESGLSNVVFHQLDVKDSVSIAYLADFIQTQFGKLDILVNSWQYMMKALYRRPFMWGKLYIQFIFDFPHSLTPDQCKALETVLPRTTSVQLTDQLKDMVLDECEVATLHRINIEEIKDETSSAGAGGLQRRQQAYEWWCQEDIVYPAFRKLFSQSIDAGQTYDSIGQPGPMGLHLKQLIRSSNLISI